jgi:hypothetical protein
MKDAKIWDGSAWQSLKGPPGPSAVSADAGNLLATGSDRLLFYGGLERYEWEPYFLTDNLEVVTPQTSSAKYYSVQFGETYVTTIAIVIDLDKQYLAGQGSLVGLVRIPIPYLTVLTNGSSVVEGSAIVSDQLLSVHFADESLYIRTPNAGDSISGVADWSKLQNGRLSLYAVAETS